MCPPGLRPRGLGSAAPCGLSRPPEYPSRVAGALLAAGGSGGKPHEAVSSYCQSLEPPRKAGGAERVPGRGWSGRQCAHRGPGGCADRSERGPTRALTLSAWGRSLCSEPRFWPGVLALGPRVPGVRASRLGATVPSARGRRPAGSCRAPSCGPSCPSSWLHPRPDSLWGSGPAAPPPLRVRGALACAPAIAAPRVCGSASLASPPPLLSAPPVLVTHRRNLFRQTPA